MSKRDIIRVAFQRFDNKSIDRLLAAASLVGPKGTQSFELKEEDLGPCVGY